MELLGHTRKEIRNQGYEQVPTLAYKEGLFSVPFMITAPRIFISGIEPETPSIQLTDGQRLLAGIAIVAGIYHLLKRAG